MTMTFRTALAALARIEAGRPQPEDVERVRDFVERVEGLAQASLVVLEYLESKGLDKSQFILGDGLRDVLREGE